MSRYEVYTGRYNMDRFSAASIPAGAAARLSKYQGRLVHWRDRFRAALPSTEFNISDLLHWNTINTAGYRGDAFLIEHLVAGVPSGKQWAYFFSGPDTTNGAATYATVFNMFGGVAATIDDFFVGNDNTVGFNTQVGIVSNHYNNDARDDLGNIKTIVMLVNFSGANVPTANQIVYSADFEKQLKVISYNAINATSGTARLQMKRGPKPIVTNAFIQLTPSVTFTAATCLNDSLYDFGFDDWSTLTYALPLSTSGGANAFVAGSAVDQVAGTGNGMLVVGPTGTGVFRRDSGNKLFLTNVTGSFVAGDTVTAGTVTRTISAVGSRDFGPGNIVGGDTNYPFNIVIRNPAVATSFTFTTGTSGFMPKETRLLGICNFTGITNSTDSPNVFTHVLDNTKPFMQLSYSNGKTPVLSRNLIQGEILTPYLAGDTRKSCNLSITMNHDNDEVGTSITEKIIAYSGDDSPGAVVSNWVLNGHEIFNFDNTPSESSGLFAWDLINVTNSVEFKGYVDNEIMRVAGAVDDHLGLLLSGPGGPFIKYHRIYVFPWVTSKPPIFGPKWAEEPGDDVN